jgi:hypothetical protein
LCKCRIIGSTEPFLDIFQHSFSTMNSDDAVGR